MYRAPLSTQQAQARRAALASLNGPIKELAQQTDVLPLFQDWTAFLGLGPLGECLWVDQETHIGRVEPASELLQVSILLSRCGEVEGLQGLVPPRPAGRPSCPHCGGAGKLLVASGKVEAGCMCGGLGWLPTSVEELGVERVASAG